MTVSKTETSSLNRRAFLGSSAQQAASVAAGMLGLSTVASAGISAAHDLRIGVIGVRNQGKDLAVRLAGLPGVNIAALCDVDESQFAPAIPAIGAVQSSLPRTEHDFRRLLDDPSLDAVVVATPDHWHAPMGMQALQAGKHLYLEAPITHRLKEGVWLQALAENSRQIVQCGLPQRSGPHFHAAIDYLRSGQLGKVLQAKAWTFHVRKSIGHRAEVSTDPDFDHDLWLGPAVAHPYQANRSHYNWRWFWDYGSGELGHWGVHLLDVALWGLELAWPTQITAVGGKFHFDDDQETPDTLTVHYRYPQTLLTWEHRLWSPHGQEGRSAGVAFYGDRGTLVVDRGGWKVYDQPGAPAANGADSFPAHLGTFVAAIRGQATVNAPIEVGHLASGLCHLGNIAYRTGRTLHYQADKLRFENDPEADAMLAPQYRAGWSLR